MVQTPAQISLLDSILRICFAWRPKQLTTLYGHQTFDIREAELYKLDICICNCKHWHWSGPCSSSYLVQRHRAWRSELRVPQISEVASHCRRHLYADCERYLQYSHSLFPGLCSKFSDWSCLARLFQRSLVTRSWSGNRRIACWMNDLVVNVSCKKRSWNWNAWVNI